MRCEISCVCVGCEPLLDSFQTDLNGSGFVFFCYRFTFNVNKNKNDLQLSRSVFLSKLGLYSNDTSRFRRLFDHLKLEEIDEVIFRKNKAKAT